MDGGAVRDGQERGQARDAPGRGADGPGSVRDLQRQRPGNKLPQFLRGRGPGFPRGVAACPAGGRVNPGTLIVTFRVGADQRSYLAHQRAVDHRHVAHRVLISVCSSPACSATAMEWVTSIAGTCRTRGAATASSYVSWTVTTVSTASASSMASRSASLSASSNASV